MKVITSTFTLTSETYMIRVILEPRLNIHIIHSNKNDIAEDQTHILLEQINKLTVFY
jgi:hypothetical protein